MVARFRFIEAKKGAWEVVKTSNGPWMQYTDHEQALAEKDREIAHLKEKVAHYDRWLSVGVYFTVEEYQERVYKPHQQLMAQAVRFAESVADYDPYHGGKRKKDAKAFLKEHNHEQHH